MKFVLNIINSKLNHEAQMTLSIDLKKKRAQNQSKVIEFQIFRTPNRNF